MPEERLAGQSVTIAVVSGPPRQLAERPLTEPHPSRLDPDHPQRELVLELHAAALERGEAGYLDPGSGLYVLTAGYLAQRGYCCNHGCRHCPFVA